MPLLDEGEGRCARRREEANRVLSPSGMLLCHEPAVGNPFNRATSRVFPKTIRTALGEEASSVRLTGFPPIARRLGRWTPRLYPMLSRAASTHRLSAYRPRAC